MSVRSLGVSCQKRGEWGEAESLYRRALEANTRMLGAAHPESKNAARSVRRVLEHKGGGVEEQARLRERYDI